MSDRYQLLIDAMRTAANTVLIIAGLSMGSLLTRWSIRLAPVRWQSWIYNIFDLWLVTVVVYIIVVTK
jgi:hypothetical protein